MPETISFIDANNHVQNVSPSKPLPVTSGGGGASLADTLMEDNNGVLFIIRDSGTALTYIKAADGTSFTPAAPIQVAYSANIATAANQATANASLATIATAAGTQATAAGTQATAAKQDTGNTSLATVAGNTAAVPVAPANIATNQAAMTSTAAQIVAARTGAIGTGRVRATIYNIGPNTIYIGASGVTTGTGLPLLPGGSFDHVSTAALYGICGATLTSTAAFMDTF